MMLSRLAWLCLVTTVLWLAALAAGGCLLLLGLWHPAALGGALSAVGTLLAAVIAGTIAGVVSVTTPGARA